MFLHLNLVGYWVDRPEYPHLCQSSRLYRGSTLQSPTGSHLCSRIPHWQILALKLADLTTLDQLFSMPEFVDKICTDVKFCSLLGAHSGSAIYIYHRLFSYGIECSSLRSLVCFKSRRIRSHGPGIFGIPNSSLQWFFVVPMCSLSISSFLKWTTHGLLFCGPYFKKRWSFCSHILVLHTKQLHGMYSLFTSKPLFSVLTLSDTCSWLYFYHCINDHQSLTSPGMRNKTFSIFLVDVLIAWKIHTDACVYNALPTGQHFVCFFRSVVEIELTQTVSAEIARRTQ